jgi:hypothetical protein
MSNPFVTNDAFFTFTLIEVLFAIELQIMPWIKLPKVLYIIEAIFLKDSKDF